MYQFLESEHEMEMDQLIGLIVKMRCEDLNDFKKVVENLINLLTDKDTPPEVFFPKYRIGKRQNY